MRKSALGYAGQYAERHACGAKRRKRAAPRVNFGINIGESHSYGTSCCICLAGDEIAEPVDYSGDSKGTLYMLRSDLIRYLNRHTPCNAIQVPNKKTIRRKIPI